METKTHLMLSFLYGRPYQISACFQIRTPPFTINQYAIIKIQKEGIVCKMISHLLLSKTLTDGFNE